MTAYSALPRPTRPDRYPNVSHRIAFGNAVSKWLRKEAKRKKITVAEVVRRIVMQTSGHF